MFKIPDLFKGTSKYHSCIFFGIHLHIRCQHMVIKALERQLQSPPSAPQTKLTSERLKRTSLWERFPEAQMVLRYNPSINLQTLKY